MSRYVHKRHNFSVLIYHFVCPAKYRKVIFDEVVDMELRDVCIEISKRYEVVFLEIGVDRDHVHFLVQTVPTYSPRKVIQTIKSITSREIFKRVPSVKRQLWGGEFWSKGYFVSSVGKHGNETTLKEYVKNQCNKDYKVLHQQQLELF